MAGVKLSPRPTMAMISLALLFNVLTLARMAAEGDEWETNEDERAEPQPVGREKLQIYHWIVAGQGLLNERRKPYQLFTDLKDLKKTFDEYEVPQELNDIKNMVNTLFEGSRVDAQLCTNSKIAALTKETFSDHPQPLYDYMLDYKTQFLQTCTNVIMYEMQKSLKEILSNRDQLRSIDYLARDLGRAIANTNNRAVVDFSTIERYPEKFLATFIEAVRNNLQIRRTWIAAEGLSRRQVYETYFLEACKSWLEPTERARSVYEYLREFEIRTNMLETLMNGFICKFLHDHDEKIQENLQLYREENVGVEEVVAKEEPVSEGRRATIAQRQDLTRWRKWML